MEPTVFPISQDKHIIFCIIATLLFLIQFARTKRWYQLVMALAIPASLLIYIQPENTTLYYAVGITEVVLLLLTLILNIIQSAKIAKAEKLEKSESEASTPDAEAALPVAETEE